MTSQGPRIYTYKITFDEVPYYYYGVHKEKVFDEEYWGSPKTHKWAWDFYTPKKQILEVFDFTDEGWLEAQEVEKRLITPVLNNVWCLNEHVGGIISLEMRRKGGKKAKELGIGFFGLTPEQRRENNKKAAKISGKKTKELGVGIFGLNTEQLSENGKKGCQKTNSQKWLCLETGFITNPGNLTQYQRARGIDTSKRIRIS